MRSFSYRVRVRWIIRRPVTRRNPKYMETVMEMLLLIGPGLLALRLDLLYLALLVLVLGLVAVPVLLIAWCWRKGTSPAKVIPMIMSALPLMVQAIAGLAALSQGGPPPGTLEGPGVAHVNRTPAPWPEGRSPGPLQP